jgi:hypothetical protein
MKYLCAMVVLFLVNNLICVSDQLAITENGEEVILLGDKTWRFKNEKTNISPKIKLNFSRGSNSTFLIKSKINGFGVYLNPKNYIFKGESEVKDAEFSFTSRKKNSWGLMINETIGVPLKSMRKVQIENLKETATNIEVLKEEYIVVNGIEALHLRIKADVKELGGLSCIYCTYSTSNKDSTTQLTSFTTENNFNTCSEDMYELLNGLTKLDSK